MYTINKKGERETLKFLKIGSFICLFWSLLLISNQPIYAYSFTGKKICTFYVNYRWGGSIIPVHQTGFQQAVSDWNSSQSKKSFRNNGSTANGVLDSYSFKDYVEYGYAYIIYDEDTKCVTAWVAKINKYYTYTHYTIIARSVGGHELGHILGLNHTANPALMNSDRDRSVIYRPQTDDINGINALY